MALSNFEIFNSFTQSAATEVVDQLTDVFNTATRNALRLVNSSSNIGDLDQTSSYQLIANLYGNRDPSSTAALASVPLGMFKENSVKIGMGSRPVSYTGTSFDWTRRDPREAGIAFGQQVGAAKFQYMLNSAIAGAVGAIDNLGTVANQTTGNASLQSLNQGSRLFGDRAGAITTWIMHSKSMHDIYDNALNNSERLFVFENVQVMEDGFGRILVMTDSPALFFDNAGTDNYYQVGLVADGIMLEDNGNSRVYEETQVELDNAKQIIKEESDFNLMIKGFSYEGAVQPDDADIALGTNWTQVVTSVKDTAGVLVQTL